MKRRETKKEVVNSILTMIAEKGLKLEDILRDGRYFSVMEHAYPAVLFEMEYDLQTDYLEELVVMRDKIREHIKGR